MCSSWDKQRSTKWSFDVAVSKLQIIDEVNCTRISILRILLPIMYALFINSNLRINSIIPKRVKCVMSKLTNRKLIVEFIWTISYGLCPHPLFSLLVFQRFSGERSVKCEIYLHSLLSVSSTTRDNLLSLYFFLEALLGFFVDGL